MRGILCSDWLREPTLPARNLIQEKNTWRLLTEFVIFGQCQQWNLIKRQRLKINKSFLILIKAKYFCYITNLLLSKFVRSRWLLGVLWTETKSWSIKTPKKELGQHGTILTSRLVKNVPSVQYLGFAILPKTSS